MYSTEKFGKINLAYKLTISVLWREMVPLSDIIPLCVYQIFLIVNVYKDQFRQTALGSSMANKYNNAVLIFGVRIQF